MDPTQLQPGHRLDRYELLCPLAYGGMASVWLARFGGRRGFERLVVVKMILPQFASDPRFQEMFVDEARIASRIEHANVARILDVGEHDENTTYIVMEWVDGDSLSKLMRAAEHKKQRVPLGIVLRICADAAAGLHAAHVLKERDGRALGVVHRDVSPQNILLSNAGSTVIIDFGVAKARDRVSQDTSAGQLKGKIRYMAPEQALGHDIDHRADVWAMGVILYELFSGESPYEGPNEVATLHLLTSGSPPAPLPWHVPDPLRTVVDRALAYNPDQRYSTALELNVALEGAMIEIGEPTTVSVVADYIGHMLADRKMARKRQVDIALDAAYARDADRANNTQPSSISATSSPPITSFASSSMQQAAAPAPPAARPDSTSAPSIPSARQTSATTEGVSSDPPRTTHSHHELPSRTSAPTPRSAAMDQPTRADAGARTRRVVTVLVLGMSVVAGLIGAGLIVSTTVLRREASKNPSVSVSIPPETNEPPPAAPTTAPVLTNDAAAPVASAPAAPPATTATLAPSASASTTPGHRSGGPRPRPAGKP